MGTKKRGAKGPPAAEGAQPPPPGASARRGHVAVALGGLLAAVAAAPFLLQLGQGSGAGAAEGAWPKLRQLADQALLEQFPLEHNESLLWGTYRPGVLVGVKSRTFPESVVAGLMWTSVDKKGGKVSGSKLRHTCEESETRQGLVFGYSEHNGRSYGRQQIKDPQHSMTMETVFFKASPRTWVLRAAGNSTGKRALYFYLGVDSEYSEVGGAEAHVLEGEPRGSAARLEGRSPQLGAFELAAVASTSEAGVAAWGAPPGTTAAGLKDALLARLRRGGGGEAPLQAEDSRVGRAPFVVLQLLVKGAFEVDFVFTSEAKEAGPLSGAALSARLSEESAAFASRFDEVFPMGRQGGLAPEHVQFARAAMSAMLGGIGHFYGSPKVKGLQAEQPRPRPLFTAVPSRSFFPRGFLWDEGFHQLLVGRWDPALSRDIIAHWLGAMRPDGWIPREQILGAEALSKVPDWAVEQNPTHANPPSLLLAIESLVQRARPRGEPADPAMAAWLRALFPAVEHWFHWFRATQAGKLRGSFRWRGRDAKDGKLNAMTLSSGLDDYPRASAVSDDERHVDLHSWMAFGAGVLARMGAEAGLDAAGVREYEELQAELVGTLDEMHWDEKRKRYGDYGLHCNDGVYLPHIVVKCGKPDGSSVEHAVMQDHMAQAEQGTLRTPLCPPEHPDFLFPLGDGAGGLLMREKFKPRKEKLQFVHHTGYVSLFPFFLKLIPADSPKLGHALALIGDERRGLWSDFGLRSMAPSDKMYLRDNSPGDAPYWRGPIWMNCNYLAVSALRHYAGVPGPHQEEAARLLSSLSQSLSRNVFENFRRTGWIWEQYNPKDGKGQRTHPFNGWSSLVVLIMADGAER